MNNSPRSANINQNNNEINTAMLKSENTPLGQSENNKDINR